MHLIALLDLWIAAATTFLALLFLRALLHKASDIERFTGFLTNYHVLPQAWLKTASYSLIAGEAFIVALLLTPASNESGVAMAISLLAVYASVIAINVAKGNTRIECGCGGPAMHLSYALVLRNIVIALMALPLLMVAHSQLTLMDTAVAVACGAILYLLYIAAEQLLANFNHTQLPD
jgi:Methylamine utilisation protein MauE